MEEIVIDSEFRELLPLLPAFESEALEQDILARGCLDSLKVWENDGRSILIDGHNRLSICQKHNIPYRINNLAFASREDAFDCHRLAKRS